MSFSFATAATSSLAAPLGIWLSSTADRARAGWAALRAPATHPTATEHADRVRAMADRALASDPVFAQELYAAADRHELAHATPA